MALFRRKSDQPTTTPPASPLPAAGGGNRKDRPTPSRKQAEAARRQRVTRTMSKKEARREASRQARANRLRAINAREGTPEKALLRDYVDARFSPGEYLLPSLVVLLLSNFLAQAFPQVAVITTLLMYAYILLVVFDGFLMWRGFKKVLAERLPGANPKGLALYGMNRSIQIRRLRMPPPRIKRGEPF